MMRDDGLQCVFDPVVFKDAIMKLAYTNYHAYAKTYINSIYGVTSTTWTEEYMKMYSRSDITQIFPDKCWVNTFYDSEFNRGKFRFTVKIVSLTHGTSALSFSAIMFGDYDIANILYDNFGMIPRISESEYRIDTEAWLRHRFQNLIWEQRDIDKLARMVEDPLLKFTLMTPLLNEFLEKTTEYEWPEATMILLRAIHDRKEGRHEEEKPMRL